MKPDLTQLKTYIMTQRQNGFDDNAIAQVLVSSGWSSDMVTRAFADIAEDGVAGAEVAHAPDDRVQEYTVANSYNEPNSEEIQALDKTRKNHNKVKVIGIVIIVLGALMAVAAVYPYTNSFLIAAAVFQIVVGIGILRFNWMAYAIFNIFAILVILSGLLTLISLPMQISLIATLFAGKSLLVAMLVTIGFIVNLAQLAFYIYGGIVFHNKDVRALFARKRL